MIHPIELHARHSIGFALEGEVTADELRDLDRQLSERADEVGDIRLYIELRQFSSLATVAGLLRNLRERLDSFTRVKKYAIVTDASFVRGLAGVAGYVSTETKMEVFKVEQAATAKDWLVNDMPETDRRPAVSAIADANDDTVAIAINGRLESSDYKLMNKIIDAKPDAESFMIEIQEIRGMSLRAIIQDLRTDLKAMKRFRRIALCGHQQWLPATAKVSDWITPGIDIRFFESVDRAAALGWLATPTARTA